MLHLSFKIFQLRLCLDLILHTWSDQYTGGTASISPLEGVFPHWSNTESINLQIRTRYGFHIQIMKNRFCSPSVFAPCSNTGSRVQIRDPVFECGIPYLNAELTCLNWKNVQKPVYIPGNSGETPGDSLCDVIIYRDIRR